MIRDLQQQLLAWQTDPQRKPLLLTGARQVGKTHALKTFANTAYTNHVYLNFEDAPRLKQLFEQTLKPETLLKAIAIEYDLSIHPEKTLIILDEIQECPEALNSLKYFNETANQYHLAAAGSLLGVTLANTKGFPVGKVNFLAVYPLSFSEYLTAIGKSQLRSYLSEIETIEPLPENLHQSLLSHLQTYLYMGGMPGVIQAYIDKGDDIHCVRKQQNDILHAYQLDFAKHAPRNHAMKVHQVWDVMPSQLAKENKKFVYSVIRKGA